MRVSEVVWQPGEPLPPQDPDFGGEEPDNWEPP